jgi:hypothetical protein
MLRLMPCCPAGEGVHACSGSCNAPLLVEVCMHAAPLMEVCMRSRAYGVQSH